MCGGGTTCIEATFLKADQVICSDIDPISVLIVKATLKLLDEKCGKNVDLLREALALVTNELKNLWCMGDYCYIHTFLTRECTDEYCIVPKWLGIKRVKRKLIKLAITEECSVMEAPEVDFYEKIMIPREKLVRVANGVYAYATELYRVQRDGSVERTFVSLCENSKIAEHLVRAQQESKRILGDTCTPIPEHKETKRLKKNGVFCWEQLFTLRQLLTLKRFIEVVQRLDSQALDVAVALTGTAMRTLSLLAFYYQPYGKVNPGLVIKSYWLPKYPVELNPLAGDLQRLKTIGRGTLVTYVRKVYKTCNLFKECSLDVSSVVVVRRDAFEAEYRDCDIVILDPPYPAKVDYEAMASIYSFAHDLAHRGSEGRNDKSVKQGLNVHDLNVYTQQISGLIEKIVLELKRGGKIYLLLSSDRQAEKVLKAIIKRLETMGLNIRVERKGPYIGEAPGKLGRSRNRNILVLKIIKEA